MLVSLSQCVAGPDHAGYRPSGVPDLPEHLLRDVQDPEGRLRLQRVRGEGVREVRPDHNQNPLVRLGSAVYAGAA